MKTQYCVMPYCPRVADGAKPFCLEHWAALPPNEVLRFLAAVDRLRDSVEIAVDYLMRQRAAVRVVACEAQKGRKACGAGETVATHRPNIVAPCEQASIQTLIQETEQTGATLVALYAAGVPKSARDLRLYHSRALSPPRAQTLLTQYALLQVRNSP